MADDRDRPDPALLELRPFRDDEFGPWIEASKRDYAAELRRNLGITDEQATTRADADIDGLIPEGLATPGSHLWAIEHPEVGGRIGHIWLQVKARGTDIEAFGLDFHIEEQSRGLGLGRRAMELAEERARELGATRLALNVFGDNERAQHLYRTQGFEVTNVNMSKLL